MARPVEHTRGVLVDYLITFVPWMAYVVFTRVAGSWKYGFLAGLAFSALVVTWRTLRHDDRFFDSCTLGYCAVMAGVSTLDPTSPISAYNLPLSLLAVSGISGTSLVLRSPFTYRIERKHLPPELLADQSRHDVVYRAHVIATRWWVIGQGAAAGISALLVAAKASLGASAVQLVGVLVPVGLTRFHHERSLRSAMHPDNVETSDS